MTSAPFSMVDALIFRPYPVPHPGGVVTLVSTSRDNSFDNFSYREYLDIRAQGAELRRRDRQQRNSVAVGFSARPGATPRIKAGMMVSGQLLPRARRRAAARARISRRRRSRCPAATPCGARAGFLEARVRRATRPSSAGPFASTASTSPSIGVAPESFPGMLHLRASRLLHAAGDGAACSRPTRRRTSSRTATIAS